MSRSFIYRVSFFRRISRINPERKRTVGKEGLPIAAEDWADDGTGFQRKRWTWTNWTQDDPASAHIMNPRVVETRVGDITNVKRTTVEYLLTGPGSTVSVFGIVNPIFSEP